MVNAEHAQKFQGLLDDLEKQGYKNFRLDQGGGYNYRPMRGSNNLSRHATGDALDINPANNPYTKGPLVTDFPPNIRELAEKNGLRWGGDWKSLKDAMHFEVPRGASPDAAWNPSGRKSPLPEPDTTGSITAMKQAQDELQQLQQPIQSIGQSATQVVPNLGGMTQGLTGLVGPLTQAVPGLGQFGGAIQALLAQLMAGFGGGAGLAGGLGKIFGFAEGGTVQGPGTSTSDSIPAMLSKGEYVVNAKAAGKHGHLLEAINTGRVPAFATGGIVGVSNLANSYSPTLNIHVNGAQGGNRLAAQIAGEVGKTLDNNRPDTFRRSEGQAMADTHARLQRYGARNN